MVPEVLIVGVAERRSDLVQRIEAFGYDVATCRPNELNRRVRAEPAPVVIIVCMADADAPVVMASLRRSRRGAAIPVILHGELGEEVHDLADVLDLGGDHFLEDPIDEAALASALEELGGPIVEETGIVEPAPSAQRRPRLRVSTEVIDGDGGAPEPNAEPREHTRSVEPDDPALGQLHRTLDLLEARLSHRSDPRDEGDDVDLASMGFDAVPDVEDDGDLIDPGESHDALDVVEDDGAGVSTGGAGQRAAAERPETTVRLNEVDLGDPAERGSGRMDPEGETDTEVGGSWAPAYRARRAIALPVSKSGSLEEVEVPLLLWKLTRARVTGSLELRRGRVQKRLWLADGSIVFARSNLREDRLVDALLRRGLLTRDQYQTARRLAAKEPRRAGQLLVEAGFLKPRELHSVLHDHLTRIVDSTFAWTEGAWEIETNATCNERVVLDRSTGAIIMEGVRRRMETHQLWALIGGAEECPRLTAGAHDLPAGLPGLADDLQLSLVQEACLERLDGKRTLGELIDEPDADEHELLTLVYGLHVLDLVELLGEPEPDAAPDHDPAALDRHRVMERLALARDGDYFALLGLEPTAARLEVRRAFAELYGTFADQSLEASTLDALETEVRELRAALEDARDILSDDAMRSAYLAHLEEV